MSSGDEARLVRQKTEYEEQVGDWYERWGEEQVKNAELEQKLAKSEAERKRLSTQTQDQSKEVNSSLEKVNELQEELDRIRTEKQQQDGKLGKLQPQVENLDALVKVTESTVKDTEEKLREAEKQRDELAATNAGLHAEYDQYEADYTEKLAAFEQNADAQEQLDKVLKLFQEEFTELAKGVNIDDYLKQFRETVQGSRRLRRDESQSSLASALGEPHSGSSRARDNRNVSGASIGDELRDQDHETDEESDDEDAPADGDAEETLKDFQGIEVGVDPHQVNNWAGGEATVEAIDDLFGEKQSMSTQTPRADGPLIPDPFPRAKNYRDAEMWTNTKVEKGVQCDYEVPTVTKHRHDEIVTEHRNYRSESERLLAIARADGKAKDQKFSDQYRLNIPLRDEITTQKEEIKKQRDEIAKLTAEVTSLESRVSRRESAAKKAAESAQTQIGQLENDLLEQRRQAEAAKALQDAASLATTHTNTRNSELERELKELRRECNATQAAGKGASSADLTNQRIVELESDIYELQEDLHEAKERQKASAKELLGADNRIVALENDLKELLRKSKAVEDASATAVDRATDRIRELEKQVEELEADLAASRLQRDRAIHGEHVAQNALLNLQAEMDLQPQPTVVYVATPPKTLLQKFHEAPTWLKFLLFLTIGLWVAEMVNNIQENHWWDWTNDLMHSRVRYTSEMRYHCGGASKLWVLLGEYVGGDMSLVG